MFEKIKTFVKAQAARVAGFAGLAASGVAMGIVALPAHPLLHGNPFDVTMDGVMSGAEDMFNGLWPAFTSIIGIQFGIAILLMVIGIIGGVMLTLSRKRS